MSDEEGSSLEMAGVLLEEDWGMFFRYRNDGEEKNICFWVRSGEGQGEFRGYFPSLLRTMQEGSGVGSSKRFFLSAAS